MLLLQFDSFPYNTETILNLKMFWVCAVIELHIGKRGSFLFIISFAPSLGPPISMESSIYNIRFT